ncbi:MAG: hypothetical protein PHQ03_07915 [Methylococcales bacterium]|nr:hypothetical protein [Methylococcales bacterium]MDD5215444.1 hypothetical protein [Methylococcales bacterium]
MKKQTITKLFLMLSVLAIVGCSDDKPESKTKAQTNGVTEEPISHTLLGTKVSASDKQKFEDEFAKQCVARELKTSNNPDYDKPRVAKACECVATYLMKDLTAIEAEKFLTEHQGSQSLTIKYENAAYHCLQQKAPQPPHLFSKQ